jgi:hypothetical protein
LVALRQFARRNNPIPRPEPQERASLEVISFAGERAPQFRNPISIYNFSALHFTIASSITVLAVSIGHPAIFVDRSASLLQRNRKGDVA